MDPPDERNEILYVLLASFIDVINDTLGPDHLTGFIVEFSRKNDGGDGFGSYQIDNFACWSIGKVQIEHRDKKVVFTEEILFLKIRQQFLSFRIAFGQGNGHPQPVFYFFSDKIAKHRAVFNNQYSRHRSLPE